MNRKQSAWLYANGLDGLSDESWGPAFETNQSRYSEGVCERCGQTIESGERIRRQAWLDGPADASEHLDCKVTHRFRPCGRCGGSPDIHNTNRGRDFIGHEYL